MLFAEPRVFQRDLYAASETDRNFFMPKRLNKLFVCDDFGIKTDSIQYVKRVW